jgi:MSHA pilin protein MshA
MKQQGFTLIELIIVIVILGILSAVALPRFIDLSGSASEATLDGVAGAMGSSMAINYGGCSAVSHDASLAQCEAIDDCNEVGNVMQGGIPAGYSVASVAATAPATNGEALTCSVEQDDTGDSVNFTGIVAGQ